jgi:hypothetical protein
LDDDGDVIMKVEDNSSFDSGTVAEQAQTAAAAVVAGGAHMSRSPLQAAEPPEEVTAAAAGQAKTAAAAATATTGSARVGEVRQQAANTAADLKSPGEVTAAEQAQTAAEAAAAAAVVAAAAVGSTVVAGSTSMDGVPLQPAELPRQAAAAAAAAVDPGSTSSMGIAGGSYIHAAAAADIAMSQQPGQPQATAGAAAAAAVASGPGSTSSMGIASGSYSRTAASAVDIPMSQLLQELGLQQFAAAFEQEFVESVRICAMLSRQDFKEMGIPKGPMLLIIARCSQLLK